MPFQNVIVTHGNCPDGATAVLLAKKVFKEVHAVHGVHHSINDQIFTAASHLDEGGHFYLTDICGDPETLEALLKIIKTKNGKLSIFEHHQTREFLKSYKLPEDVGGEIVFDLKRSGALIFYDYLVSQFPELQPYEKMVRRINDRDIWLNLDPESPRLGKLHHMLGDVGFITRFLENPDPTPTHDEALLLDYQAKKDQEKIDKILEKIEIKQDENNLLYGVVYGEADSSEMLHQAIMKNNLEYAIHLNLHSRKGSIRSRGTFDCATWAEKRGGGGHRGASGFPLKFERPRI